MFTAGAGEWSDPRPCAGGDARLSPRVLDVLNGYLRVISVAELSDPVSLARLARADAAPDPGRDRRGAGARPFFVTQFVVN